MKIGILTYQRAHNYGAVLQAYALRTYLKSMGFDVEVIDYWPEYREKMYSVFDLRFLLKKQYALSSKIKSLFFRILNLPLKISRYSKFNNFIYKYILTTGCDLIREGKNIPQTYDVYVYGSDQIWRYNTIYGKGFDEVYFGVYPKNEKIKISYAASMGVIDDKNIDREIFKQYLNNFELISVRENDLKTFLDKNLDICSIQVLDPVFLLSREEWESISKQKSNNQEYVLFYELNISKEAENLAKQIAIKYHLKIIKINGGIESYDFLKNWHNKNGPLEFINLFRNASYVVSTSFHGVAFSIIFEKNFFALGFKNNYERALSLLRSVNLEHRFIRNQQDFVIEDINFIETQKLLQPKIEESKYFLENIKTLSESFV